MKRIITLVLVFVMLFSIVACATQEENKPNNNNTNDVKEKIWDKKDYDFEGFDFVILGGAAAGVVYDRDGSDLDADSLTGNEVIDAVYNRNMLIEETYNCTITHVESSTSSIQTALLTGADEDVSLISIKVNAQFSYIEQELLLDLYDEGLVNLNLKADWYNQNTLADTTVNGKAFCVGGDMLFTDENSTWMTLFNKELAKKYIPDVNLYDLVREGKWTIDRMIEMVEMVSEDKNGDGVYNADDVLGLLKETPNFFLIGAGILYTGVDENGIPVPTINNERTIAAIDKVRELMNIPNSTIHYVDAASGRDMNGYANLYSFVRSVYFADEHFLFTQIDPGGTAEFIDMERGFGVLPNPKLDEEQEAYYHMIDEWSCAWYIPSDTVTLEKTDILFTAWNYMSLPVVDAFYEKTLKLKRADAPEDSEMLDIVRQNPRYEISLIFDLGIANIVTDAFEHDNFASTYARKIKAAEKMIDKKFGHLVD